MTEREQLRAAARAAGLRLTPGELERLLPAWRRYQDLVRAMRKHATRELGLDAP
jgi:predicted dehydrogenase